MKLRFAALLLAAHALVPQAHATVPATSAFASATNFRISLTDLDLNDGIAASLEFLPPPQGAKNGLAFAEAQHVHLREDLPFSHREYQTAPWQSVSTSTALKDGAAALSASGTVSGSSLSTLSVSVKAGVDNPDGLTWAYGRALVPLDFRLTPNTALSLSFDLTVGSTHAGVEAPGAAESNVYALFFASPDTGTQWFDQHFVSTHSLGADRFGDIGAAGTRTFTADITSDHHALNINLLVHASASALAVSPVPEPHTWSMLLAGFALVGAFRARRERAA